MKGVNSGSRQADPISAEVAAPLFLVIGVHVYAKYMEFAASYLYVSAIPSDT